MQLCPSVLPLENWSPEFSEKLLRVLNVQALMLYPDTRNRNKAIDQRNTFIASYIVKAIAFAEEAGRLEVAKCLQDMLPLWSYRLLQRLPDWQEFAYAHQRGRMAGELLLCIFQLEEWGLGGTLNRALKLLQSRYDQIPMPAGARVPHSRKTLMDAWTAYKPIAHFWAAQLVLYNSIIFESSEYESRWWCENLGLFLGWAEVFRQFGISHIPPNQKKGQQYPTLSPTETWFYMEPGGPRELGEPRGLIPAVLSIGALSEQEIAFLKANFNSL